MALATTSSFAPPMPVTSNSNNDSSPGLPPRIQSTKGPPPNGTENIQPPSSSSGLLTGNPFLTISDFSQKANRLVLAPASAAAGASCSASFSVTLADASKSVGALKWNSLLNVFLLHPTGQTGSRTNGDADSKRNH